MEVSIDSLRELCHNNAVKWTTHIVARLQERGIRPTDIISCINTGHIIEQYPDDYPFPSCLVLGDTVDGSPVHAVIGVGQGQAWLITAYYPTPDRWEDDFTTRKERQE